MKTLYIDTPMGISGDMFLGALIDAGVSLRGVLSELRKLPVDRNEISVRTTREVRHSISAVGFRVKIKETHHHRDFRAIKRLIRESGLTKPVKALSTEIFRIIAEAEGKVHGISPEKVHFHEVGAMDSIIDIVGAAVAVDSLSIGRVVSSPVPTGSGWTETMHGRLPIPAPATVEILKGVPIAPSPPAPFELTTPTGAAIIKALAGEFGPLPAMTIERAGYGAGKKDFKGAANVLRVVIGESAGASSGPEARRKTHAHGPETLHVIETNIDDMSPQVAGYLTEKLLGEGALDAYVTPVVMKKSRPGLLLTVLSTREKRDALMGTIFGESTSIGVRTYPVERHCLERKFVKVRTPWGRVNVKVSLRDGSPVSSTPEYEDCRLIAEKKRIPLKKVMEAAALAASEAAGKKGPGKRR